MQKFMFHSTHFKSLAVTGTSSMTWVPAAVCAASIVVEHIGVLMLTCLETDAISCADTICGDKFNKFFLESCSQSSRLTSAAAAAAAAAPNPTGMLPAAVVSMHLPSHLLCVACQSLCLFQCTSVQLKGAGPNE